MELIVGGGGLVWLSLVLSGFQTCSLSSRTVRTSHEPRIRRTRTLEFFKGSAVGIRVSVYKLFSSLAHASLSSMCLVNFDCFIMSVLANIGESFRYIYIYLSCDFWAWRNISVLDRCMHPKDSLRLDISSNISDSRVFNFGWRDLRRWVWFFISNLCTLGSRRLAPGSGTWTLYVFANKCHRVKICYAVMSEVC